MPTLYHYTSINSLKSILENKTIRFSTLSFVNDKYEGETQDIGNLGKYIFVSCWNVDTKEQSLMWEMYGDHFHGVRIGLKHPIFKLYYDESNNPSLVPHFPIVANDFTLLPTEFNKIKIDILYTDKNQDLKPKTLYEFWNQGMFNFGKVGKCKSNRWSAENECRFMIYTLPIKLNNSPDVNGKLLIGNAIQKMKQNEDIPITHVDLNIEKEIFQNMHIIKGPKMSLKEEKELLEIVKLYNSNATIFDSIMS